MLSTRYPLLSSSISSSSISNLNSSYYYGPILIELQILRIALQVVKVWKSGISSMELIKLEESYARYHLYVASVLGTDAAHSTLPHGMFTSHVTPFLLDQICLVGLTTSLSYSLFLFHLDQWKP